MKIYLEKTILIHSSIFISQIIILIVSAVLMGMSFNTINTSILVLGALNVIAIIVSTMIINKKVQNLLDIECNPEKYVELSSVRLKNANKLGKQLLLMNISAGLIEGGKLDEAKNVLDQIGEFPNTNNGNVCRFCLYNNLFDIHIKYKNYELAQELLDKMNVTIKALKNSYMVDKLRNIYIQTIFILSIAQGKCENAEPIFIQKFNSAKNNREKVATKYVLGRIYILSAELDKAKDAFNYVINNGNKLHIVELAKHNLNELSE
jgi:tetratricopeptide (TPR) repeat protein